MDNRNGIRMKPHEVKRWHSRAIHEDGVAPEHAELVFQLYSHAAENHLTIPEIAELIDIDKSNVTRVLQLTYNNGKLSRKILAAIKRALDDFTVEKEREMYGAAGFVDTSLSKAISEICHATRINQEISQIWGESQTGKSEALKRYAELDNHGRTRYVELKSGMSHRAFMQYLASRVHANTYGDVSILRGNINRAVTRNTLLIFDELHKPLLTAGPTTKIKIMDSIRDLNDEIGCGILLCGTHTMRDEFTIGNMQGVLKQMDKRGVIKMECPPILPIRDVWKFSGSYGLPRPKPQTEEYELAKKINRINGIGMLTKFLKAGMLHANKQKERYSWKHFITAHDIIVRRNQPGWWLEA